MDPSPASALAVLSALAADLPEAPGERDLGPVAEAVFAAAEAGASPDQIAVAGRLSVRWVLGLLATS
ncbi:hypothetical protein ACFWGN_02400 [Oerskovia sp. NPDC060338]|uniref:hypothetical protein n=1 Tax=Oerskovia sp. NPDC060338 TaxID=3347100 RepID=UPI00365424BD